MRKSAKNLINWHTLSIQYLPSTLKCSLWPYPYSTLSKFSNETKIAQFRVLMRKLWHQETKEEIMLTL